jgi:hypothetical protein
MKLLDDLYSPKNNIETKKVSIKKDQSQNAVPKTVLLFGAATARLLVLFLIIDAT